MVAIAWRNGVVGALAVAGVVLAVGVAVGIREGQSSRPAEDGFRLDAAVTGIDFGAAPRTLILAIQQDCPACAASMPFYRRLTDRVTTDVQVVVAAGLGDVEIERYLSAYGIEPDAVVRRSSDTLPVSVTPTLLLVDATGLVEHFWVGLLSAPAEQDLLTGLFGYVSP